MGVGASLDAAIGDVREDLAVGSHFSTISAEVGALPHRQLMISFGPALQFQHLYLDENIGLDTAAIGFRGRVRAQAAPFESSCALLFAEATLVRVGEPMDRATYFNQQLGGTTVLTFAFGLGLAP